MTTFTRGATSAERRAHIEAALAEYPHVDAEVLADLLHWFRKEASTLDIGVIASDPRLGTPYQMLKSDHLDRLSGVDLFWRAVIIIGLVGCIVLMI